jgi:hypothetical protein
MITRIKIKTTEDNNVHFDTAINNYTLCGMETGGDSGMGFEQGIITNEKVNCLGCIRIVEFCHQIKKTEYKIQ